MEAAVIDKIVALTPPTMIEVGGLQYSSKSLSRVNPPVIGDIDVFTLNGLLDLLSSKFELASPDNYLVHVVGPAQVRVVSRVSDEYKQRTIAIEAAVLKGDRDYTYGQFLDQEVAIIGLQSCFVPNATDPEVGKTTAGGDIDYVLKMVASLTCEDKLQVEDTGISQNVTVKNAIAPGITDVASIKPRVSLAPYRTFREVEQPKSDFVLRVNRGPKGMPQVGLFEADGGAWKMDAIHNVRDYLKAQLPDWTIVA